VIGTVAAGALALVGVSVASAQSSGTNSPNSSSTTAPPANAPANAPAKPFPRRGPGFGFGPGGIGTGGAIYGTYVRPNGSGYQTIDVQTGTVTAVTTGNNASITVKSVDGHTQAYTVNAYTQVNAGESGIGSVKVGDTVSVQADATAHPPTLPTAMSILDGTNLGSIHQHWKPLPPPTTTPSTTSP
jgi:hypothetical protein